MEKPMRQALVTLGQLVDWEVLAERLPLSGNPWFPAPTKSRPQLAPTVQSRDPLPLPDMGGGPGRFLCPVARYGAGKRKRQEDKKGKKDQNQDLFLLLLSIKAAVSIARMLRMSCEEKETKGTKQQYKCQKK